MRLRLFSIAAFTVALLAEPSVAQEAETASSEKLAGHSYHGEAFNEGPRQKAYLMEGLGRSKFPISTENEQAQLFFNQGIDQLHGFWYFEAERSFRQAAILDADCAMVYWGLAMANVNNADRAKEFIAQAKEKSEAEERETSEREKLYIAGLVELYKESVKEEKTRAQNFVNKLDEIVLEFPDDVEAKAFLACQIWMNQRKKLPISSHIAVDALLDQVFEADPMHPAHHYRIHLWDYKNAEAALQSAANCGPANPDIAHMWHMPGHIYSKLKRYEDAVWQQEASARIDHRHMMHDQILPDQIHNFAHNNEWCVRNLNHVGRVSDAIDLATNMISMPRHPKYNHLKNRGSTYYGRQRLFETLSRYELWPLLIEACLSSVLEPTEDKLEQVKRLRHLGRAYFRSNDTKAGQEILDSLQEQYKSLQDEKEQTEKKVRAEQEAKKIELSDATVYLASMLPEAMAKSFTNKMNGKIRRNHKEESKEAVSEATKDLTRQINVLKRAVAEMEGLRLLSEGAFVEAAAKLKKAGSVDAIFRASVLAKSGDKKKIEKAIKDARKYVDSHKKEVQPLANLCWLLWELDKKDEAIEAFQKLREFSGSLELQSPVFARLQVIADAAEIEGDWRIALDAADDLGDRPEMDKLGPFRWQPSPAKDWLLVDANNEPVALKQYQGKPVVVIFYLGHGCLHCAEQLQAFSPMLDKYREAGIEIVAISTDKQDELKNSIEYYDDKPLAIQLVADPELEAFKSYRVYDEFEDQPLHGTFLIDGEGKIRWQDVSYEPFMEPEFLLKESVRLLSQ